MNDVLRLAVQIPVAVVATLLALRLLGVRRSWVAVALAGALGWITADALQVALHDGDWGAAGVSVHTVALAVLFTMLTALALDLVARPGSLARGQRAGLLVAPHPFRDIRRALQPYGRVREIAGIARGHGLSMATVRAGARGGDALGASTSVAVRATLEDAGVVFVKLGQAASMRDDLLPDALTAELSRLHSRVDPAPRSVMEPQMERELGRRVDDVFAEFDWEPIGSASVAQAYLARLPAGDSVIVKVQRPDIEAIVARDSATLRRLASVLERRTPVGQELHVTEIVDEFVRSLQAELDFNQEAANAIDLAAAVRPESAVRIPRVYRDLTTRRVLVEERFDGISVDEREQWHTLGVDGTELADRLVRAMTDQLLHGHFHADPHPGNVLVLRDGSLGLIDFGLTGHVDPAQRMVLFQLMTSAAAGDGAGLRDAIEQVAVVGSEVSDIALDQALARFAVTNLRPGQPLGPAALNDLVALLSRFDIRLPANLTTCLRTLVLLEGTVRAIEPGYQLMDGVRRALGDDGGSPASTGAAREQLEEAVLRELPRLQRLPGHVERIAALTARGDLRVQVGLFGTAREERLLTALVNRMALALLGGLVIVGSTLLLTVARPGGDESPALTEVFGFVGLAIGAVLVLRVVAGIVRDG